MKRFYKQAGVAAEAGAFLATLDGKPIMTPARARLELPTRALAEAVAAEWEAQAKTVDPAAMPVMRLAATAIDRVALQRPLVIEQVTAYGGSDLLCYRAESPAALVERQEAAWQPLLDEAAKLLGVRLSVTRGVVPLPQPEAPVAALREVVAVYRDFPLAALHSVTAVTGSLVIGLLLGAGAIDAETAWEAAQVDEDFQVSRWGEDEEAARARAGRRGDLLAAARFLSLCRP